MRLSSRRWLGPIPAAFVLQAIYGLLFANGVFVSVLHDVVLTKAFGIAALFTSLGITACGIVLHNASDLSLHHNVPRFISIVGSLAVAAQTLMAYGLHVQMPFLVYFAAALLGTGSGSVYVVSIVILQEWVPESPGFATGLGLLIGGAGSLFGIYAFQVATISLGGVLPAMALTGVLSGTISLFAATIIERPPTGWSPLADILDQDRQDPPYQASSDKKDKVVDDNRLDKTFVSISFVSGETESLLPHKESTPSPLSRLSITDILGDPAFPLVFISVCAAVGPGFGFVLAFPQMVNSFFGVDVIPANKLLFWVTFVGVAGRIAIGIVIDLQSSTDPSEYGFNGAKRTNTALLALQCIAFAFMPICVRYGWINLFAIAAAMVYVTFSGGAVVAACLARSMFSPENSTLAFALLGIAIGIGRSLFSCVVAACGKKEVPGMMTSLGASASAIYGYDYFVQLGLFVSTVGLVLSHFVSPSKAAYNSGINSPMFADFR